MSGSNGSITDVQGLSVGHAHNLSELTGCTVVLCDRPAIVGVDVRGAAPATRETDLCRPGTIVERADAVLLSGGSAFGLSAAAGVMRYLFERGIGHKTPVVPVPIVPAACIFDLGIGEVVWPDEAMAYQACLSASNEVVEGCVGAGTGATVGKVAGIGKAMKSGVGTACERAGSVKVGALFVANALGDVVDPETGQIVAGTRGDEPGAYANTAKLLQQGLLPQSRAVANTTIGVVATDAILDPVQTNRLAMIAHDGLAHTVRPAHTMYDGDAVFSLATGRIEPDVPLISVEVAVVRAVQRAVLDAVRTASSLGGLPAASDWVRDARPQP